MKTINTNPRPSRKAPASKKGGLFNRGRNSKGSATTQKKDEYLDTFKSLGASEQKAIINGVIDLGKNFFELMSERERTSQTIIESQRDITLSNNEVEKVRLEMNDRQGIRQIEYEQLKSESEITSRDLSRKEKLLNDDLSERSKLLERLSERDLSEQEFQVLLIIIESQY
ncbi:hypothetical protein [Marinomonas sp. PE14-40]|uniref:hypothetical protein n=1 Tax=Marinomonas sp. PE14-40 TaxID=3060621 RepID=UPI003F67BF63